MPSTRRVTPKNLVAAAAAGGAAAVLSAAGTMGAATYFARMIVTPDRLRPDDIRILGVQDDSVTLELTEESGQPGRYGLWFDGGRGHARVGPILSLDETSGSVHSVHSVNSDHSDHSVDSVRRVLEGVDHGELRVGPARWNGYYFTGDPRAALGLSFSDVQVESENGSLAAWAVPGVDSATGRWAILVHGRGATREECLRAVPVLHDLGFTTLIPMYRNDLGAPSSSDGRYSLGLSEWRDLEAAILYAVDAGARDITLFGWSMGGAIVLQTLDRSWLSDRVSAVVLDAPVVDWGDVLRHHGTLHRVPGTIASLSRGLIGQRWARRLVGVHEPIDVAATNWEHRAEELNHPTLLIHSLDDEFVPVGPSISLAAKRPDLVRFEPWHLARHTKEWNTDPGRWDDVVRAFLTESGQDHPENPHSP